MKQSHEILPGGLSEADHERIAALADKGWKAPRIAQTIRKHAGTVYWYMLRSGLAERDPNRRVRTTPYKRGSYWVYPYSPDEDTYIEALRAEGASFKKIAAAATERFGKPRNHHSIFVRLTILAAA